MVDEESGERVDMNGVINLSYSVFPSPVNPYPRSKLKVQSRSRK
jgi:hypothetical protein